MRIRLRGKRVADAPVERGRVARWIELDRGLRLTVDHQQSALIETAQSHDAIDEGVGGLADARLDCFGVHDASLYVARDDRRRHVASAVLPRIPTDVEG